MFSSWQLHIIKTVYQISFALLKVSSSNPTTDNNIKAFFLLQIFLIRSLYKKEKKEEG